MASYWQTQQRLPNINIAKGREKKEILPLSFVVIAQDKLISLFVAQKQHQSGGCL
jgi:hypothetical protein